MKTAEDIKNKILERDSVILICCHITNKRSLKLLRDLVDSVEEKGYGFLIASHTLVPGDIIERSAGFVFDPDNEKIGLNPIMNFWTKVGDYKITSKYLSYGAITEGSYVLSAIKNRTNGSSLAYTLGYKKVHLVEYDAQPNFEDLKDNEKILDSGSDLVIYKEPDSSMLGSVFSYSLTEKSRKFHTDFLYWIDALEKDRFFSEECFFNFAKELNLVISQKPKTIQPAGLITSFLNSGAVENVLLRFQDKENIFLFLRNNGLEKKVTIYTDSFKKEIEMIPGLWVIMDLETDIASYVHIYDDNNIIKKWDLSSAEKFQKFVIDNKIENL
jgi:hypothetical protein